MRHTAARSGAGLAIGLAIVLSATPARAADADTERARALFDEAGELERHGQWGAAQEKLRAALRLRDTPHLHYALGWALENDDKLLEAKAEYETAVRTGAGYPGGAEAVRLASARIAEIDKNVPTIKIRVGGKKGPLRIVVDGREVGRADGATSVTATVDPGTHVVRVERGDEGAIEQMVYVGRRATRTVDAYDAVATTRDKALPRHPRASPSPTVPVGQPAPRPKAGDPLVPALLLSGGIAFLAGGGGLLVSSASDANERDAMRARWCTETNCTDGTKARAETAEAARYRRAASDLAASSGTKQAIGLALGGVGVAAATVGAVLLLRPGEKKMDAARARAAIAPTPGGVVGSATLSF